MKKLIDEYKFDGVIESSRPLSELLDRTLPILPAETVVTGIPTASAHVRIRGYDHLGRLAKEFARRRELPYRTLLIRKNAATQHFVGKSERVKQAELAFSIKNQSMPETVLLLDDIVTTGATIRAAAQLLRQAGVKYLMVGVVARQPREEYLSNFSSLTE